MAEIKSVSYDNLAFNIDTSYPARVSATSGWQFQEQEHGVLIVNIVAPKPTAKLIPWSRIWAVEYVVEPYDTYAPRF